MCRSGGWATETVSMAEAVKQRAGTVKKDVRLRTRPACLSWRSSHVTTRRCAAVRRDRSVGVTVRRSVGGTSGDTVDRRTV